MKKANKIDRKFNSSIAIAALCVATAAVTLPTPAQAQTATGQGQTYQEQNQTTEGQRRSGNLGENSGQVEKIQKGSNLIGAKVENRQGDKLGKIENIVVDFNTGRVAYVVMDVDHGLFSAGKYVALPLNALQPSANGDFVILNADKNKVAQARGFSQNEWPSATDHSWGAEPFWQSPNNNGNMNNTPNGTGNGTGTGTGR